MEEAARTVARGNSPHAPQEVSSPPFAIEDEDRDVELSDDILGRDNYLLYYRISGLPSSFSVAGVGVRRGVPEAQTIVREHLFRDSSASTLSGLILNPLRSGIMGDLLTGKALRYTYAPLSISRDSLKVTRLVELRPGTDDVIECGLQEVNLESGDLNYEAISYTWKETSYERALNGSSRKSEHEEELKRLVSLTHPIFCDGKYISVSTGLRDALRRLRHPTEKRTIWIDQLSINQQDIKERNYQVQLMPFIYGNARRVVLWIGDEDEDSPPALELMKRIAPECEVSITEPMPSLQKVMEGSGVEAPDSSPMEWLQLRRFYCRPVFKRCWVVPEITVAKEVVVLLGSHKIPWKVVAGVGRLLERVDFSSLPMIMEEQDSRPDFVTSIDKLRFAYKGFEPSMEYLLRETNGFEATDPRDRVFALLSLNRKLSGVGKYDKPDYQRGVAEVYRDITWVIIFQSRSLNMCSYAGDSSIKSIPDLPSWVPDYSHSARGVEGRPRFPYKAARDYDADAWVDCEHDSNRLEIQSYHAETITLVDNEALAASTGEKLLAWSLMAAQIGSEYASTGESMIDAFWRSCIGFPAPLRLWPAFGYFFMKCIARVDPAHVPGYDNPILKAIKDLEIAPTPTNEDEWAKLAAHFFSNISSRTFFITDGGYMGLSSRPVRVGDQVHILQGADVPFVLRELNNMEPSFHSSECFTMVGSAYVHGMMEGQVLGLKNFDWKDIGII